MIINPIWFYLIDLSDTLKLLLLIIGTTSLVIALPCCIMAQHSDDDEAENLMKAFKFFGKTALILLVLGLVLPSKETSYQMLIASQVTTENVNNITDVVKNCTNYIVNALK